MTLHEAIQKVLLDTKKPLKLSEIASIINIHKLYSRDDNRPVSASQISSRINQHLDSFKKNSDGTISLLSDVFEKLQSKNKAFYASLRNINFRDPLIIPVLYFFKRIIDNPDLYHGLQIDSISTLKCNSKDFLIFLNKLNSENTRFKFLFDGLINEVESNFKKSLFHDIFQELKTFDLKVSEVSNEKFSEFFTSILGSNLSESRKSSGQYYTPKTIKDIYSALAGDLQSKIIYNPFAGQCSLAVGVFKDKFFGCKFYGEEIIQETYLRGLINLTLHNIDTSGYFNKDSFSQEHDFKADLCISNPPLVPSIQLNSHLYSQSDFIHSKNPILRAIQLNIDNLKHDGRAIILIAENFLFSNTNEYRTYRKKLIQENLIESIISLPADIHLPFTGIKSSLLVINKAKQSKSIIFFDYQKFTAIKGKSSKSNDSILEEFEIIYNNILKNIFTPVLDLIDQLFVTVLQPEEEENSLVVSRYLRSQGEELTDHSIKRLGDILNFISAQRLSETTEQKFINISDLNKNYFDFKIDISRISPKLGLRNGQLISENAILVGSIVGSFKPSYFEFSNVSVAINPNIYALSIISSMQNQVDIEYLIYELSSEYILNQILNLAVGTTSLRRISRADLLNLRIKIPTLEEQKIILKNKKDALLAARITETRELAKILDITSLSETKILEFVNHELGNIKGAIVNDLNNLQNLIVQKSNKNEILFLDTKITKRTVGDIFSGLINKFDNISSIMETIQNILHSTKENMNIKPVKIKEFIKHQVETLSDISNDFHIVYSGEELFEEKDYSISIDKKQFAFVIRNFIINSHKHGYNSDNLNYKNIVFDVREDDDFFYIDMINDGKPFDKDFSLSDFTSFGKRMDANKGSGLGGYLMNKIIENHSGKLELLEPASLMAIPNDIESEHDNEQRMIFPGVHFRITLPKTE